MLDHLANPPPVGLHGLGQVVVVEQPVAERRANEGEPDPAGLSGEREVFDVDVGHSRSSELNRVPRQLKRRTRLFVIGQDDPKPFQLQARTLGVASQVEFLKGRSDIPRFLLGADLLIHPAYNENTGTVLLEALVAGLPVLVTDVCGYAHYIAEAECGRVVPSPFEQSQLDRMLADMLADDVQRSRWAHNALSYADKADLYSMPQRAADVILTERP